MNGDTFISTNKANTNISDFSEDENNFFVQAEHSPQKGYSYSESLKHLNDFDSNILGEDAYKDVNDEIFKLEYKISKIEEELSEINKQIQTSNEIYDYYSVEKLSARKSQLEKDLKILTNIYNEASISAKITGSLTSKIRSGFLNARNYLNSVGNSIVSKIPGKLSSFMEIRNSLNKLENINKSVNELMNCRYPYGEAEYRYEQLSRYIARANSIQSDIYKFIK